MHSQVLNSEAPGRPTWPAVKGALPAGDMDRRPAHRKGAMYGAQFLKANSLWWKSKMPENHPSAAKAALNPRALWHD
jgi:hypothetical protein